MTFEQYLRRVNLYQTENPHVRYGQALFNVFCEVNPALAHEIQSTEFDPFFTEDQKAIDKFIDKIYNSFEKS